MEHLSIHNENRPNQPENSHKLNDEKRAFPSEFKGNLMEMKQHHNQNFPEDMLEQILGSEKVN